MHIAVPGCGSRCHGGASDIFRTSGAAASDLGVRDMGNDVGGSIRYPAAACGVVGLRHARTGAALVRTVGR